MADYTDPAVNILVRYCLLALAVLLPVANAAAQEDPQLPPPPKGVTVNILSAEAPQAEPAAQPAMPGPVARGLDGLEDAPKIKLDYNGETVAEALEDLGKRLGVIILCHSETLLARSYYRHVTVPHPLALQAAVGPLMQSPRPAFILCEAEQVRKSDLLPQIKSDLRLSVDLKDANLTETLKYLSKVCDVAIDSALGPEEQTVTFSVAKATLEEALKGIAEQLGCALTTGFVLESSNIVGALDDLEKMSDEDLEKMFARGLAATNNAEEQVFGSQEQAQNTMRAGMMDGVRMFQQLEPDERRELIAQGAALIQRFAAVTQRLSPETRQAFQQRTKPFLGVLLGGYMSLPGQTRAEIGPLMKALQAFGW